MHLRQRKDLYTEEAGKLIEDTTDQVRYQVTLENSCTRPFHRVDDSNEIKKLMEMMQELMTTQAFKPKICELCKSTKNKTDECPTLFEDNEVVIAIEGWASNRIPQKQELQEHG